MFVCNCIKNWRICMIDSTEEQISRRYEYIGKKATTPHRKMSITFTNCSGCVVLCGVQLATLSFKRSIVRSQS